MIQLLLRIWNDILISNLFNFVLMLLLLGWILKKFNIADKLEAGRKSIEDRITLAKITKENAKQILFDVQERDKEVDREVYETINHSVQNAVIVGERLIKDAEKQAESYDKTTKRAIETNIEKLRMNLTDETAQESIRLAKNHIVKQLDDNRDLHIRYINESIDALKGVEF